MRLDLTKGYTQPVEKRGFTLIELLVVIAIIGILSSVVLASLSTARAKSRDARRIADLDQVRTALELFNDSNGNYASSSAGLQQFAAGDTAGVGIITPTFMSKLPGDPTSGAKYFYCPETSKTATTCDGTTASSSLSYVLGTNLERSDNNALKTDADETVGSAGSYVFNGTGTTCNQAASGGTEQCYDITP